jgi:hypothetical protein
VQAGKYRGHDSDHSFAAFVHLGGTGRNLAQDCARSQIGVYHYFRFSFAQMPLKGRSVRFG